MGTKPELQSEIRILTGRKASAETELQAVQNKVADAKRELREVTNQLGREDRRREGIKGHADEYEGKLQANAAILFDQHETIKKNRILLANHADHRDELVRSIDTYEETKAQRENDERRRLAELLADEHRALSAATSERKREEDLTVAHRAERATIKVDIDTRTEADNVRVAEHERKLSSLEGEITTAEKRLAPLAGQIATKEQELASIEAGVENAHKAHDIAVLAVKKLGREEFKLRGAVNELKTEHRAIMSLLGDKVEEQKKHEARVANVARKEQELVLREQWLRDTFKNLDINYR